MAQCERDGMTVKQSMLSTAVSPKEIIDRCCTWYLSVELENNITFSCSHSYHLLSLHFQKKKKTNSHASHSITGTYNCASNSQALNTRCQELDLFLDTGAGESDTLDGCCRKAKCSELPRKCSEMFLEADPAKSSTETGVKNFQQSCCRKKSLVCSIYDQECRKNGKVLRSPELRPEYAADALEDCCVDACTDDSELQPFCQSYHLQPRPLANRWSPHQEEMRTEMRMSSAKQKEFKTEQCCMGYFCSDFYRFDANACERFSGSKKVRKRVPAPTSYVFSCRICRHRHSHHHSNTLQSDTPMQQVKDLIHIE